MIYMWVGAHVVGPVASRPNPSGHGRATWRHAVGKILLAVVSVAVLGIPGVHVDPLNASCRHGPISTTSHFSLTESNDLGSSSRQWHGVVVGVAGMPGHDLPCRQH